MYQQISISSIFLGLLIYSTYAEEILIQIVVKKPINIVSDRYVSFSIDPSHLLELSLRPSNFENSTILAKNIGAAYFKIGGSSSNQFTLDDETIPTTKNQVRIAPSDWQALHQWIRKTNLKPIVSLPYSSKQWSPRNIISILGISNRLGIRDCMWQLGTELNTTETIIDYVDDLNAFKTIIDVFKKNGNNWGVVGADITTECKADEAELYAELSKHISEANGWIQSTDYTSLEHEDKFFFEKNPGLRSLLKSKVPVWLDLKQSHQHPKSELCGLECELKGLRWADTLGTSAQTGFKVVFQKLDKFDVTNPSYSYYVSLLHKKIMGEKVFDTKILNGDNLSPKYFTHCTRNMSGSFSVMGVNFADYKTKISTKLPIKYTGSEVHTYVLNVERGQVLLNGIPVNIDSDLQPVLMVKKQNRPTTFVLPPRSIGFWVFPLANLKQCSTKFNAQPGLLQAGEKISHDLDMSSRTASEKLLHDLIFEILQIDSSKDELKRSKRHAIVKKDSKHMNRMKRNADPGYKARRDLTLFKKFNDEAFANRMLGANVRPRRRVTRQIHNMNNMNVPNNRFSKLFKTFELPQVKKFNMAKFWNLPPPTPNTITRNPAAIPAVTSTIHDVYRVDPSEQFFKSVENSELPNGDVFFQIGEDQNMDYVAFDDKPDKHRQQKEHHRDKFVDFDIEDVQDVPDHMYEFYNDAMRKKVAVPEISPYSELWESDVFQKAPPPDQTAPLPRFDDDNNNLNQNIDLIVKELPPTFRQNRENLMKAKSKLSSIYVHDGDRMSSSHITLPIRQFEMDDDAFFVSRKKRSIDSSFNDEIENKVNSLKKSRSEDGEIEEYAKNGVKINLLEKITKIIDSLEKIDDIEKYNNIEKLTNDIKELENFLFRRSSKFNVFKPKNRISQKDIRRKCKILSVNLEQQCLKENDFYSSRLIKRDAKYNTDYKAKKISSLKNVFPKEKTDKLNRARRNTAWESTSWEDNDKNNMIIKELYTTNEGKYNYYVPSISYRESIPNIYRPNEEDNLYTQKISVLQNLPNAPSSISKKSYERPISEQSNEPNKVYTEQISVVESFPDTQTTNSVMQRSYERPISRESEQVYSEQFSVVQNVPETYTPNSVIQEIAKEQVAPAFSVDRNLEHLIENHIEGHQEGKEYQTPKFMKKISNTVENWMDTVEKHVSGWWHILS